MSIVWRSLLLSISVARIISLAPLPLGLILLIGRISLACLSSINLPSWVGLVIFLIYVGGLLVIFSYFIAIQPNQQLGLSTILGVLVVTFPIFIATQFLWPLFLLSRFYVGGLLGWERVCLLALLAIVLLLALVIVVKVAFSNKGSLRPF